MSQKNSIVTSYHFLRVIYKTQIIHAPTKGMAIHKAVSISPPLVIVNLHITGPRSRQKEGRKRRPTAARRRTQTQDVQTKMLSYPQLYNQHIIYKNSRQQEHLKTRLDKFSGHFIVKLTQKARGKMGFGIKIDKADKVFSQYIRLRDKRCMRCGSAVQFNEKGLPISLLTSRQICDIIQASFIYY